MHLISKNLVLLLTLVTSFIHSLTRVLFCLPTRPSILNSLLSHISSTPPTPKDHSIIVSSHHLISDVSLFLRSLSNLLHVQSFAQPLPHHTLLTTLTLHPACTLIILFYLCFTLTLECRSWITSGGREQNVISWFCFARIEYGNYFKSENWRSKDNLPPCFISS